MKLFLYLPITLLSFISLSLEAAECSAIFPDAASTHKNGGSVTFDFNSAIAGSPDNILDTERTQFNNSGSSVLTCSTADCTASGSSAPALNIVSFKTTKVKTDINVSFQQQVTIGAGSNNSNEYDQINSSSASEATITFSSDFNEYIIDKLVLGFDNTLNLQAGSIYWINEFVLSSSTRVVVQGTGTAIVFISKNVTFPFESLINSPSRGVSGDASKLVIYADKKVDFAQSTFSGSLYTNGTINTGFDSRIFGAVSADRVNINNQTIITYQAAEIADTDFGALCEVAGLIHHYDIIHPSQGFTCEPADIEIRACQDGACTLSNETVSLNFTVDNVTNSSPSFEEMIAFEYSNTTEETVKLGIANASIPASEDLRCNGSTLSEASDACNLTFVDSGFQFIGATKDDPVPNQLAEKDFTSLNLRAIKDNQGVCEAALEGQKSVTLDYSCVEPSACIETLSGIRNGLNNTTSLTFDNQGIAALSQLNYPDAGKINLTAAATISGATIIEGTTDVVVLPDKLKVEAKNLSNGTLPNIIRAGSEFNLQISALGVKDKVLPNYRVGNMQLALLRTAPIHLTTTEHTASIDGLLNYGLQNIASNISATFVDLDLSSVIPVDGIYSLNNLHYSEFAELTLDIQDTNYFSQKLTTDSAEVSTPISLGSFIPAYFELTSNTVGAGVDEIHLNNTCAIANTATEFSYLGQIIASSNIDITITAMNTKGAITTNYETSDHWAWLSGTTDTSQIRLTDENLTGNVSFSDTPTIALATPDNGIQSLTMSNIQLIYSKDDTPYAEFTSDLDLNFLPVFFTDNTKANNPICHHRTYDATDDCDTSLSMTLLQTEGDINNVLEIDNIQGTTLRWGRLRLQNGYAPENEDITLVGLTEFFDGNRFIQNIDDNCTAENFLQTNFTLPLTPDINEDGNSDIAVFNLGGVTNNFAVTNGETQGLTGIVIRNIEAGQEEYSIQLIPVNDNTNITWDDYLNFDWNDDGVICNLASCLDGPDVGTVADETDFPSATISFGLFRGNDRIIQWREVFN